MTAPNSPRHALGAPLEFSGDHLSELALSVAADGEILLLSQEARTHLVQCAACEARATAHALNMLEIPDLATLAPPAPRARPSLFRPLLAALTAGGFGLVAQVASLDASAVRRNVHTVHTLAAAAPVGGPLLSLVVAAAATALSLAVIRHVTNVSARQNSAPETKESR